MFSRPWPMPPSDARLPKGFRYGRALRLLIWSILVLILGMVCCFGLIQTRTGKDLLVSWVSRAVESGTGMPLHIEGLTGLIPFDFVIGTAAVGETSDPWLRIEGLSFQWFPEGLLSKRIHIGRLEADGVEVLRRPPESGVQPEPESSRFEWPISLPPVLLERFAVGRLYVDGSILGEAAEFTASGRMTVSDDGRVIRGDFRVGRPGSLEEMAGLRWILNTSPMDLELDFDLIQPEEGFLSRFAGVHAGASRVRVTGKGPPGGWEGDMEVETQAWGSIRCDLQVDAARDRVSVKARGDFDVNEDLIEEAAAHFPGVGTGAFSLSVAASREGTGEIDHLALNVDGMDARISGVFDINSGSGEARLDLAVPDLAHCRLPGFAVSSGRLHAALDLKGSLDEPLVDLTAEVSDLRAQGIKLGSAKAVFLLRPEKGAGAPFLEGLGIRGEGSFYDGVFETGELTLHRQRVNWDLDMSLMSTDMASVSRLRVFDGNLDMDLSGPVRISELSLEGSTRIRVEDLAKLPFLEESGFKGSASLTANIKASGMARSAHVDMNGRLKGLGPIPSELHPLVGDALDFRGSLALEEDTIHVFDLRAVLPGVELSVHGNADLIDETADLSLFASLPDAGVFSSLAGRSVGGSLEVKASLYGGFRDPKADVEAVIRDLDLEAFSAGLVRARLHAHSIWPAPEGRINLDIVHEALELAAASDVALDMPFLRLREIRIEGAGARILGELAVHLQSGSARGGFKGVFEDLAPVAALLDEELSGRVDFSVGLSEKNGTRNIELEIRLDDLESFAGRARSIQIRGEMLDVLGDAAGEVHAGVSGFQHGDTVVEELSIRAGGRIGSIDFDAEGSGLLKEPFRVSSRGVLNWSENARVLGLELLNVEFGAHRLMLAEPSEIRLTPETGPATTSLLLQAEPGRLEIRGGMAELIDLTVFFEEIPLGLLTLVGGPPMDGHVAGTVSLSGTVQDPEFHAELAAENVGVRDPALSHVPGFDLSSGVSLKGGLMEARLTVAEGESRPMEVFLAVPVSASLSPVSLEFPGQGLIKGHVTANLDLGVLPAWFSMEGLRLSGRLSSDLSLSGSVASPLVEGHVRINDGTCDVLQSGSVFREVEVLARVSGNDLILDYARAVDGRGGSLEAQGRLQTLAEAGFPFEGRLGMNAFNLVGLDELKAVTGGDLKISGTMNGADLSGSVRVASAEVRIPDRLPPRIQELEVVELNGSRARDESGEPEPKRAEAEVPGGFQVDLDLAIEIPGRTYVRGRGLDSEWKGALQVGGTAAHPEIRGDLAVVRGHFDFFGDRYSLTSGNVFLDGSYPPEPIMDVTAERRKAGMTGRIILSGRPSTLSIRVTSDPPLPEDEVMARLLFGRNLTTITPIQALKLAQAMAALAGGNTVGFVGRAQRAMGLDQLELVQSDDPGGSTALSVGKHVSDEAYVAVEKGLGKDGGKISVEYEITPRITVQTEAGTDSGGGVELKWKWDY